MLKHDAYRFSFFFFFDPNVLLNGLKKVFFFFRPILKIPDLFHWAQRNKPESRLYSFVCKNMACNVI